MKKITVTLVALLALILLVAGCTPTNETQSPTVTPTPTSGKEVNMSAVNAGETFRYFYWNTMDEENPFAWVGDREQEFVDKWHEFEEEYGIYIKYVKSAGGYYWQDLPLSSAAAGEPICDIFCVGGPYVLLETVYYNNQLGTCVIPISDYAEYASFDDPEYWDQGSQESCTFGGKLYAAVPQSIGSGCVASNTITLFNKELLSKAGYSSDMLYEASKNGEWDWEAFADAAVKCSDPDAGIYGTSLGDNIALGSALVVTNGGHYFERTENGDVFVGNKSNAVEAWDFIVELASKNAIDTSRATEANSFGTGKVAMLVTSIARVGAIYQHLKFEYGILNPPKGPQANDYISEMNWFTPYAVMKGANNPAGSVQVLNAYFSPQYGINSEDNLMLMEAELSTYLIDQGSMDTALNISKYTSSENYFLYQTVSDGETQMLYYLYGNVDAFISGDQSPQVFYDSVVDKVNSLINSVQAKS